MQNKSVKGIKEIIDNLNKEQYLEYVNILKDDERKSVQKLAVSLAKKLDAIRKEEERLELINTYENDGYEKGYLYIGGIDEVGRGPLAGPVVAAVVVLPPNTKIEGIDDSKKIKESSRMICENFGGEVPQTLKELTTLPGVGRKTADVVLSNAFNHDAIAVDTHVFRVTNRIGIVNEKNVEKTEFALMDVIPKNRWSHSHHLFIFHGRRMCKARKPECDTCPIKDDCDYYNNLQK